MDKLAADNGDHFDGKLDSNNDTDFSDLIQAVIEEIGSQRLWISHKWTDTSAEAGTQGQCRLLDYACGAGTASKALVPFVNQAVGLDLSETRVAEYNQSARNLGYGPEKMQAYQLDLLASDNTEESITETTLFGFDVIVISMALHHVTDPKLLLRHFAKRLNPEGVCVVVDQVPTPDGPDLEAVLQPEQFEIFKKINTHGYTEEEMRKLYQSAGLGKNFEYVVVQRPLSFTLFGHKFSVTGFMARGELV